LNSIQHRQQVGSRDFRSLSPPPRRAVIVAVVLPSLRHSRDETASYTVGTV